jgi:hypothetical protein
MVNPVRASASWTRDGTPDEAVDALVTYGRTHNARVKADSTKVTLTFGSKIAYRLMGLATWRVPYVVQVAVAAGSPGPGTSLVAEACSNAGFYFLRIESATLEFECRIAATLDELQQQ